jgi:mRNA interferase HigB
MLTMKVHIIKEQTIRDYIRNYPASKAGFNQWFALIKIASLEKPQDIVKLFTSSDILGNGSQRVVFNIGGNKYRMIVTYYFGKGMLHVFIVWIGTHAEYSRLCAHNQQYTIKIY